MAIQLRKRDNLTALPLVAPFVLVYAALFVWPSIQMLVMSFTDGGLINAGQWVGGTNYLRLMGDRKFWVAVVNTLYFVGLTVVPGTVIGLGITRLLMGVAGLVQHPDRAKISPIHLLWTLSILVELILFWWWEFALYEVTDWSFGIFAFLIFYAITLFLLAALLFPDNLIDYSGYEDFFLKRRHWFFGVFGLTFLLDIGDTAHSSIVSLAKPDWPIGFDTDAPTGEKNRIGTLTTLAQSQVPGVGHIQSDGDHFKWDPTLAAGK